MEALSALGDKKVTMRVTLSYFIEPGPGQRGWKDKYRSMPRMDCGLMCAVLKRIQKNLQNESVKSLKMKKNRSIRRALALQKLVTVEI